MRIVFTIVASLSIWNSDAQIRWQKLVEIKESDPAFPALKEWQKGVSAKYKEEGVSVPIFSSPHELPFDSLKKLLPGCRFFAVSWSESPVKEKEAVGLAFGLAVTLVCDAEGKVIKAVSQTGNYEGFGELLNEVNVVVRNTDDAKKVWEVFCDLHQKHWKDQTIERKSDAVWHLGVKTIGDFRYYYEVQIDKAGKVLSGKLHADRVGKGE